MKEFLKYIWLLLAIIAFVGVCFGHNHQIVTFGISSLMYVICRHDSEEEEA